MSARTIGISLVVFVVVAASLFQLGLTAWGGDGGSDGGVGVAERADGGAGDNSEGTSSSGGRDVLDSQAVASVESYIGLTRADAVALAEDEGRPWRVGHEDGVGLPLDDDLRPGRVTFDLEDDVVTDAEIEEPFEDGTDPSAPLASEDADAAVVLAAATTQILTVDHSFGAGVPPPFSDVRVATNIGGTGGKPLAPLALEMIAVAVTDTGASLEFTEQPQAMIDDLFDANRPGVAVVTIGTFSIEDGRAQVDVGLWCGSVCGVYLTYEVVETDGVWAVTGPIGPIAIS